MNTIATRTIYLMNPYTGSVDTRDNWMDEMHGWEGPTEDNPERLTPEQQFAMLIEVRLVDDAEVPADFQPSQSNDFEWEAVE